MSTTLAVPSGGPSAYGPVAPYVPPGYTQTSARPPDLSLLVKPMASSPPTYGPDAPAPPDLSIVPRSSMKVRGRQDMLLGPPGGEQPEESDAFRADVISIARAGIQREMAFYIARVNQYREANNVSFDEALRAVGGQLAENPDPNERLWLQVFGQKVEDVGVSAAATSASDAVMRSARPEGRSGGPEAIEGEMSREDSMRGTDWRSTIHKGYPAWHWGYMLYQHPDLRTLMDRRIGQNRRVTMKDVEDVYEKLEDNPFYREYLIRCRDQIARLYGAKYYAVMPTAPPPSTTTELVPRAVRSGSSGGAITLRPRGSTYV